MGAGPGGGPTSCRMCPWHSWRASCRCPGHPARAQGAQAGTPRRMLAHDQPVRPVTAPLQVSDTAPHRLPLTHCRSATRALRAMRSRRSSCTTSTPACPRPRAPSSSTWVLPAAAGGPHACLPACLPPRRLPARLPACLWLRAHMVLPSACLQAALPVGLLPWSTPCLTHSLLPWPGPRRWRPAASQTARS